MCSMRVGKGRSKMLISLLHVFLLVAFTHAQSDDWIDPTDMLNYDAASGKMRESSMVKDKEGDIKSETTMQTACLVEKEECQRQQENLLQKVEECNQREQAKSQQSSSNPILKRYLNKILIEAGRLGLAYTGGDTLGESLCVPGLGRWGFWGFLCLRRLLAGGYGLLLWTGLAEFQERKLMPDETNTEGHYDAEIILTRQTLSELSKFLNDEDWKPGALDDALSDVLINFKQHNYEAWQWKFEDYFGVQPFTLFMVLLCLLCIISLIATELWTHISWFTQLKRLFIISIIISFGWNWMYLYKVAFAKHQADMAKKGQFDSSCVTKMDWSESLVGWFKASWTFQDDDPCEQYYKTLLVNPILMVPPTKALVLTYTHFVTEPLKHVGRGIGEFIKGLLNEIPMLLQIPVLVLMALAVLGFCYGAGRSIGTFRHLPRLQRDPPDPIDQADRNRAQIDFKQPPRGSGDADSRPGDKEENSRPQLTGKKPEVVHAADAKDSLDQTANEDRLHHVPNRLPPSEHGNQSSVAKAMKQASGDTKVQQGRPGGTLLLEEESRLKRKVGSNCSSDNTESNQNTVTSGLQNKEDSEQPGEEKNTVNISVETGK